MSGTARRSGACEVLRERCRGVSSKQSVRIKCVLTCKQTWEEIEDAIKVQVCAKLEVMFTAGVTHNVDELPALDCCFARTEVVPPQLKKATAGLNACFHHVAIGFAGFTITSKLETKLVNQSG